MARITNLVPCEICGGKLEDFGDYVRCQKCGNKDTMMKEWNADNIRWVQKNCRYCGKELSSYGIAYLGDRCPRCEMIYP